MTDTNPKQAAKAFILVFILLVVVIFGFWQTVRKNTNMQMVQVTIPEKKASTAIAPFIDGAVMRVTVGSATTSAEVVQSDEKKKSGLSTREKLDTGTGMLFVFNNPGPCPNPCNFWNKDMLFPIDIVWIYNDKVVDLYEHLPPYKEAKDFTVTPKTQVNFILEVPDGFIKTNNIKIGDTIIYAQ